MKKVFALFTVVGLAWLPVAASAQDAAVEDATVVAEDGGTPTADAAVEDATVVVEDGGTTTADAAIASDAATDTDAGPAGCGDLTIIGTCSGDTVRYCLDGELAEFDCATIGSSCALVDCDSETNDCWGYDCVAAAGEACGFAQGDLMCEAVAGMGCIGGVCATTTTCTGDRGDFVSCAGDVSSMCFNGTVQEIDCSEGGAQPYTCAAPANSNTSPCVGLAGGSCGTSSSGTEFGCASGLTCTGGICTAETTGTDAGSGSDSGSSTGSDAGSSGGDGDGDGDSGAEGCGCSASHTGSGAALLLAGLLGLVAIRRRR